MLIDLREDGFVLPVADKEKPLPQLGEPGIAALEYPRDAPVHLFQLLLWRVENDRPMHIDGFAEPIAGMSRARAGPAPERGAEAVNRQIGNCLSSASIAFGPIGNTRSPLRMVSM